MSLRTDYDVWHERVFNSDPEHEDESSPWYELVREQIGSVTGLRILEVACGRGGFVKELSRNGAHVTGCDFHLRRCASARKNCGRREMELRRRSFRAMPKLCLSPINPLIWWSLAKPSSMFPTCERR